MNMISNVPITRWEPGPVAAAAIAPTPPLSTVLGRGLRCRCPNCGEGPLFEGYLTVTLVCRSCGAPLGLARADDLPPYLTILLVGHIVVPLLFLLETQAATAAVAGFGDLRAADARPRTDAAAADQGRDRRPHAASRPPEIHSRCLRRPPRSKPGSIWLGWCSTANRSPVCHRSSKPTAPRRSPTSPPKADFALVEAKHLGRHPGPYTLHLSIQRGASRVRCSRRPGRRHAAR